MLALVSTALVLGIGLILLAQSRQVEPAAPSAPGGKLLDLNNLQSSADLQSVLLFLEDPQDRGFAARSILAYIRDRGRVDSVGELRQIRVSRNQLEKAGGLSFYRELLKRPREDGDTFPLLTPGQTRRLRPHLCVRTASSFRHLVLVYGAVFFLGFYALHFAWRFRRLGGDPLLLPAAHLLSGLGFLMMIRLRDPLRDALLFPDFAIGVGIGCVLAFLTSIPDYERSPLRRLAYVPLILSFLLSVVLILFGSGPGISDARINLHLGPVQFQPVEFIKLLLIFFLAGFFADRWEFLRQLRQAPRTLPGFLRRIDIPKLRYAAPLILAVALAVAFFFLEKDLGPALVMSLLFIILYATARSRMTGALVACAAVVSAVWIGYAFRVPQTVSARLSMWLSPWDNYVRSGGDHLAQSLWSFSAGGLFGTGLGLGDPASVPAAHTDLVLAAVGEELGFIGLVCVLLTYAVLVHRALRISACSRGAYSLFLGISAALLIGLQAAFISAGILGVAPLSGVVTPFINYGKSSTICSFVLLGILASLSGNAFGPECQAPFRKQILCIGGFLAALGILISAQAARVQVFAADRFLGRGALVVQGDGHRRYTHNPRIVEAMRRIPRGTIYDRNGIPLATDSELLLGSFRTQFSMMDVDLDRVLKPGAGRYYPFGSRAFHLLGDLNSRLNWGAPNSSYIERDWNVILQGYDDRATLVKVRDRPGGPEYATMRRDLSILAPLVRYRYRPDKKAVRQILERNRDLHLSIDIRLQARAAAILRRSVLAAGTNAGAAAVIDPETGDLLASVTYPWEGVITTDQGFAESDPAAGGLAANRSLLDRARYGLYPPGSSFKLVTSMAAMASRPDAVTSTFECKRLRDGRIGNYVRGWGKPIRDDILDKEPHGHVDMARGLIVSCNAYFAQLGTYVAGADALLRAADFFGIRVASPNTAEQLKDALPQASYGQGQVVASPLQMARVAGAVASHGEVVPYRIVPAETMPASKACLTTNQADTIAGFMRRVVTEGTGRSASVPGIPVAGKTGTAELRSRPAHAWFVGFAPYGSNVRRIAFSVLIENGRYGGRVAAPAAAEIVDAAAELGLIGGK